MIRVSSEHAWVQEKSFGSPVLFSAIRVIADKNLPPANNVQRRDRNPGDFPRTSIERRMNKLFWHDCSDIKKLFCYDYAWTGSVLKHIHLDKFFFRTSDSRYRFHGSALLHSKSDHNMQPAKFSTWCNPSICNVSIMTTNLHVPVLNVAWFIIWYPIWRW